ncbi:MAG TPA: glutaredoxin family protein [Vicinamibacteria bacterium]|nr:glutaredoxin family protein [Vicinamibacteria bacterium]
MSPPTLTLLGQPDCHLCHEMRAVAERVLVAPARLVERDVREDPELSKRYRLEIPVLLWGDREVVRHRVTEDELRRRLHELGFGGL